MEAASLRRPRAGLPIAAAVAVGVIALIILPPGAPPSPQRAPQRQAAPTPVERLSWGDEFTGAAGTLPRGWVQDIGGGGWGNAERQVYTPGTANAALDGEGHLVVTVARRRGVFTSARLTTRGTFAFRYGTIRSRVRVASGAGLVTQLWGLGSNVGSVGWPTAGEIDVMEVTGRRPDQLIGALHGPTTAGASWTQLVSSDRGASLSAGYHVFELDWTPRAITWRVDGRIYGSASPQSLDPGNRWVYRRPLFLIFNVAVGGTAAGPPAPALSLPASATVDWIRVYGRR